MNRISILLLGLASIVCSQEWQLDRPYTLRTLDAYPFLQQLHHQTTGGHLNGAFPNRDSLWKNDTGRPGVYQYQGDGSFLSVSLLGGYEVRAIRSLSDTIKAIDGGIRISGYKDSVEFWLDARIFNEDHTADKPVSWDREFLDVQSDSINGELSYTSYARYRGALAIHMGWARLSFARDAVHWGPGYWNNLLLNQNAVPFAQMSLETQIGPLTVKSLYGDLLIDNIPANKINRRERNLFAHRYQIQASSNLILAMNEITLVDSINEPILFIPIVPLFVHKGYMAEQNNNGAISFDFCYRIPGWVRVYSEFLLDDLESPISLIKNENAEAKWAYMGGFHFVRNLGKWEAGIVSEYSRIEPWVYTHFSQSYAQLTNQGYALGNQLGPNSQTIQFLGYGKLRNRYTATLGGRWWWKGTDLGSHLEDATPNQHFATPKQFLHGAKRQFTLTPTIAYTGKYIGMQLEVNLIDNPGAYTRLGFQW